MFHITPKINLVNILYRGIVPNYKKGLTCSAIAHNCVWLTNCPNLILTEQAGYEWIKRHEPAIIEIDCTGLEIEPVEYNWCEPPKVSSFEFKFYGVIEPERIVKTTVI